MATTNTTTNTSPVPDLAALKNDAGKKYNAIVESPEYRALNLAANTAWKDFKATQDAINSTVPGTPERAAAEAASAAAETKLNEARDAFVPFKQQANAARQEYDTYDARLEASSMPLTSTPPTTSTTVATATTAATAAGTEAAATTTSTTVEQGAAAGTTSTSVPITPPVTQTNINATTDLTVLPNDVDPNFIPAPPNKQINTIISEELDPEIRYQAPVFTASFPGALARQPDGTVIDPGVIDYNQDPAVAAYYAAANPGSTEVANQNNTTVTPAQTGESTANLGGGADVVENRVIPVESADTSIMIDITAQQDARGNQTFAGVTAARQQAVAMGSGAKDWRFRMSLAPSANYLYRANPPGILAPLLATDGVIFPYSPAINVTYTSSYANYDLAHTNYKIHTYKGSSVEQISITGDFTAQDTAEANYLLAVIHFFKSVTKMFYGKDQNPSRGIPPPLVYLSGFGQYQFDRHPVVVTNFTHNFPVDVDYINAYPTNNSSAIGGQNMQPYVQQITKWLSPLDRIRQLSSKIQPGGLPGLPAFTSSQNINEATRVPTKVQIQLQCLPIITRNNMSNNFSLKAYATGSLLRGTTNGLGGGIW